MSINIQSIMAIFAIWQPDGRRNRSIRTPAPFKVFFSCAVLASGFSQLSYADNTISVLDSIKVEFELVGRDGEIVRYEDFRGKNLLLAFGFTHCVHICPMISANIASALRLTEKDAIGVFVSVDTERDTPEITDAYARSYSDSMIGLSGSYAKISTAVRNFNATYVVTKSEDNYTVQHTPSIFLIGPDGNVLDVFGMNTAPREIAAAMK